MEENKVDDLKGIKDLKDFIDDETLENLENLEKKEDQEFENIDSNDQEKIINRLKEENKSMSNKNEKLENEIKTLEDRLLRTVAEYDNYRKRTAKEKEGIYKDACEDILKEMLPVLDNLERALLVEGEAEDIKKGVDMTMKQFKDALCKLGIEEIPTKEGFDPNFHNAVMHVEDNSFGNNEVVEVFLKGYKKDDRVIRHSMVKVAN